MKLIKDKDWYFILINGYINLEMLIVNIYVLGY